MKLKLEAIHQYLQEICQGHAVGEARYDFDYKEYRFVIDDGELGTFAVTKELLDQTDVAEIPEVLRRRGITLHAIRQADDDSRLVLSTDNLLYQR